MLQKELHEHAYKPDKLYDPDCTCTKYLLLQESELMSCRLKEIGTVSILLSVFRWDVTIIALIMFFCFIHSCRCCSGKRKNKIFLSVWIVQYTSFSSGNLLQLLTKMLCFQFCNKNTDTFFFCYYPDNFIAFIGLLSNGAIFLQDSSFEILYHTATVLRVETNI